MSNEWDETDLDTAIEDFTSLTLHPRSCSIIAPPIEAANFKLDNVLLQIIIGSKFYGLSNEDPY